MLELLPNVQLAVLSPVVRGLVPARGSVVCCHYFVHTGCRSHKWGAALSKGGVRAGLASAVGNFHDAILSVSLSFPCTPDINGKAAAAVAARGRAPLPAAAKAFRAPSLDSLCRWPLSSFPPTTPIASTSPRFPSRRVSVGFTERGFTEDKRPLSSAELRVGVYRNMMLV